MFQVSVFTSFSSIELIFLDNKFLGNGKSRQQYIPCQFKRLYFIYYFLNIGDRLRQILEQRFHLVARFEIVFIVRKPITVTTATANGRRLFLPVFYTQQNIVRIGIFLITVIGIVRRHQFHLMFFGKLNQDSIHPVLVFLVVTH